MSRQVQTCDMNCAGRQAVEWIVPRREGQVHAVEAPDMSLGTGGHGCTVCSLKSTDARGCRNGVVALGVAVHLALRVCGGWGKGSSQNSMFLISAMCTLFLWRG